MTEPRTEAGQAMHAKYGHSNFLAEWNAAVLAIEAEAVAAERARIAAGVRALEAYYRIPGEHDGFLLRAAVLAIIEGPS